MSLPLNRVWILAALLAGLLPVSLTAELLFRVPGVPGDATLPGYDDGTWSLARSGTYGADRDLKSASEHGGAPDINIGIGTLEPVGVAFDYGLAAPSLMQFSVNGNSAGVVDIHIVEERDAGVFVATGIIVLERAFVSTFRMEHSEGQRPVVLAEFCFNKISITNRHFDPSQSETLLTTTTWDLVQMTGSYSEGAANVDPTLSVQDSVSFPEGSSATIPVAVLDPDGPAANLTLGAISNNPQVIQPSDVSFSGTGSMRIATIEPAGVPGGGGDAGAATVTITVSDGVGSTSADVLVTVIPSNHPPVLAPVGQQESMTGVAHTVPLSITDADHDPSSLTVRASSSNDPFVPTDGLQAHFNDEFWELIITPAARRTGLATITVEATDPGGAKGRMAFLFLVPTPGNQPPGNIVLVPNFIDENSVGGTWVGELLATDPEGDAPISFALVPPYDPRFKLVNGSQIVVAPAEFVDFESGPLAEIGVLAIDPQGDGGTAVLPVMIGNVNEVPSIQIPILEFVPAGIATVIEGIVLTDPDAGDGVVQLDLTAQFGALAVDEAGPLAGAVTGNGSSQVSIQAPLEVLNDVLAAGGLVYESAPGSEWVESLALRLDDLGQAGSGPAQQANRVMAFHVAGDPFEDWRRTVFTAEQLADAGISGLLADADRDGLVTLAEYKRGKNPLDGRDAADDLVLEMIEEGPERFLQLTYNRRSDAHDPRTTIGVEFATDLSGWFSGPGVLQETAVAPVNDEVERATVRVLIAQSVEPRQFLRFVITRF